MAIFIFWSEADTAVFGFTSDPEGRNLPVDLRPWSKNGDGTALHRGGESLTALAGANPIIGTVEREGFYIGRTDAVVTRAKWPD